MVISAVSRFMKLAALHQRHRNVRRQTLLEFNMQRERIIAYLVAEQTVLFRFSILTLKSPN